MGAQGVQWVLSSPQWGGGTPVAQLSTQSSLSDIFEASEQEVPGQQCVLRMSTRDVDDNDGGSSPVLDTGSEPPWVKI